MIAPGAEWMFRALADAAVVEQPATVVEALDPVALYQGAVADVLRLIVGDLELEAAPPVLQAIYRRYQEAM